MITPFVKPFSIPKIKKMKFKEDWNDLKGWTVNGGVWVQSPSKLTISQGPAFSSIQSEVLAQDIEAKVSLCLSSIVGGGADNNLQFVWRGSNGLLSGTGYSAGLRYYLGTTPQIGVLTWYTAWLLSVGKTYAIGDIVTLEVRHIGKTMEIWANGTSIGKLTDSTTLGRGYIGLGCYNANGVIRELEVNYL